VAEDMERAVGMARHSYDAFNRGDFDAAVEFFHPEIEWERVAQVERPLKGREAVRRFFDPDVFASQRSEVHEIEVLGDFLLAHCTFHSVASGSGIELAQEGYHLWRIRDGFAAEFRYFLDRDDAVAAAKA
jgi:ketosteroid isomerase-like protein